MNTRLRNTQTKTFGHYIRFVGNVLLWGKSVIRIEIHFSKSRVFLRQVFIPRRRYNISPGRWKPHDINMRSNKDKNHRYFQPNGKREGCARTDPPEIAVGKETQIQIRRTFELPDLGGCPNWPSIRKASHPFPNTWTHRHAHDALTMTLTMTYSSHLLVVNRGRGAVPSTPPQASQRTAEWSGVGRICYT